MRAMRARGFNGYEDLELVNLPKPEVSDGKVLVLYTAAVHTTGGREGPRLRRHCCKTSLAKPRAPAAWCMESQAFRSAPRSSWKSFLS
jgi:hypothetical protein